MPINDIVALKQYEDRLELYLNGYYSGYDKLKYKNLSDDSLEESVDITEESVILENLIKGIYKFTCFKNEDEGDSLSLPIYMTDMAAVTGNIVSKESEELIKKTLPDTSYKTLLQDLYYTVLVNELEEENNTVLKNDMASLTEYLNNMTQFMNRSDEINIEASAKHILEIFCNNYDFLEDSDLEVYKLEFEDDYPVKRNFGWRYFFTDTFKNTSYKTRLADGLYKIRIVKKGNLVRELYYYSDTELNDSRYKKILEDAEHKNSLINTSLSSIDSDEDNELDNNILLNLESFNDVKSLFERPDIEYIEGSINVDISGMWSFVESTDKDFYLCAYTKDEIYEKNPVPIMIELVTDKFTFNPWAYFFKETEYYFVVADLDDNVISRCTYVDMANVIYEDDKDISAPYNKAYQNILLKRYINNLFTVVKENDKNLWLQLKNALDKYYLSDSMEYEDISDWLIKYIIENWSPSYGTIGTALYCIYQCRYRFYAERFRKQELNNSYITGQQYKVLYRTHIIPGGRFILAKTTINLKTETIETEYINSNNNALEFNIKDDDYVIFYCIDIENKYRVSDFIFYSNNDYDKINYRFNSLEVETINGL